MERTYVARGEERIYEVFFVDEIRDQLSAHNLARAGQRPQLARRRDARDCDVHAAARPVRDVCREEVSQHTLQDGAQPAASATQPQVGGQHLQRVQYLPDSEQRQRRQSTVCPRRKQRCREACLWRRPPAGERGGDERAGGGTRQRRGVCGACGERRAPSSDTAVSPHLSGCRGAAATRSRRHNTGTTVQRLRSRCPRAAALRRRRCAAHCRRRLPLRRRSAARDVAPRARATCREQPAAARAAAGSAARRGPLRRPASASASAAAQSGAPLEPRAGAAHSRCRVPAAGKEEPR